MATRKKKVQSSYTFQVLHKILLPTGTSCDLPFLPFLHTFLHAVYVCTYHEVIKRLTLLSFSRGLVIGASVGYQVSLHDPRHANVTPVLAYHFQHSPHKTQLRKKKATTLFHDYQLKSIHRSFINFQLKKN